MRKRLRQRRSIRLKGFDYSREGAYFVTMCTQDRVRLFGQVVRGEMVLSEAGRIAEATWHEIPTHYENVTVDAFVVMPDHVHGIVVVKRGATPAGAPFMAPCLMGEGEKGAMNRGRTGGGGVAGGGCVAGEGEKGAMNRGRTALGEVVRAYKARVTRAVATPGGKVWQRNYYERIVWDERALRAIRRYIRNNPAKWALKYGDGRSPSTVTKVDARLLRP